MMRPYVRIASFHPKRPIAEPRDVPRHESEYNALSPVQRRMPAQLNRLEPRLGSVLRNQPRRPIPVLDWQPDRTEVRPRPVLRIEDDHRILAQPRGVVRDVAVRVVDYRLGDLLAAVESRRDVVVDGIDGATRNGVVRPVLEEEAPGVAEQAAGRGGVVVGRGAVLRSILRYLRMSGNGCLSRSLLEQIPPGA